MVKLTIGIAAGMVMAAALSSWADESVRRPILYPNAYYESMGKVLAQSDIEDCWNMARETGASEDATGRMSEDASEDAAAMAAFGAAASAALGGDPHRAAVAGAVAGGTASMAAGMVQGNNPPPVFRRIVERCLLEKGYEVAGWE